MIEILINKNKRNKATYNLYSMADVKSGKWTFVQTLNQGPENAHIEWHHKSLFPYNVNQKNFLPVSLDKVNNFDNYKFILDDKIKVLNIQDGIEMVHNVETGKMEAFLAL